MEQIQVIAEKEMISKLLKQFTIRTFVYSFLYFATIVVLFIFGFMIKSTIGFLLLIIAINTLFLMLLSKLATTDAFEGVNTTSAPRKSLQRISGSISVPTFIFTCIFSFVDVIFLHSVFDTSLGYTTFVIGIFTGIVFINIMIWWLVMNIYEKRLLKKYLTIEEELIN